MKMVFPLSSIVLIALSVACRKAELPTAPTPSPVVRTGGPVEPATCAAASAEAQATQRTRVFVYSGYIDRPVSPYTSASEFRLYEDGKFALAMPVGQYRGTYIQANGIIEFDWEGWSSAGAWAATGTLCGNSLRVQYNPIMILTDFEDAVYELKE